MQLTISNLTKTYPNGVQAIKGIDLVIKQGMFGLIGIVEKEITAALFVVASAADT